MALTRLFGDYLDPACLFTVMNVFDAHSYVGCSVYGGSTKADILTSIVEGKVGILKSVDYSDHSTCPYCIVYDKENIKKQVMVSVVYLVPYHSVSFHSMQDWADFTGRIVAVDKNKDHVRFFDPKDRKILTHDNGIWSDGFQHFDLSLMPCLISDVDIHNWLALVYPSNLSRF